MPTDTGNNLRISETGEGVTFSVQVQPRASCNEICGLQGDALKIRLTSPPVEDAANRLCVEYLAKRLGIAKSKVSIIAGGHSRRKTVRVIGITSNAVLSLLEQAIEK